MVDFDKLRKKGPKPEIIHPREIFRRLPKPPGINDLYTSQTEVLENWFARRTQHDCAIKLHTGGGKTLVGLLLCQSSLNETKEPVMCLVPNKQLVKQTVERAREYGIPAVEYGGKSLPDDFLNCKAILVAPYAALFHGFRNKFGLRGQEPQAVGTIVLDDAHVAFSVVRDAFTVEIESANGKEQYDMLVGTFRKSFEEAGLIGTFDDIVSGKDSWILEVPYWAWRENLQVVRDCVAADTERHKFSWPLIRDRLPMCHLLVSRRAFTITPMLPFVDMLPTFTDAKRRVYMSATIADDSEIIRTFDADEKLVASALTSRAVAGISERMILVPGLMSFKFDAIEDAAKLMTWVAGRAKGVAVLVPSNEAAQEWKGKATIAEGPDQVDLEVARLQSGESVGPVVFANRYDGIDLPGDSCRLLVMHGLPRGTSSYDMFRAAILYGGNSMARLLAQRVEQGIGRGARGSGDHCVVMLLDSDLSGWVARDANFRFLTAATRAQLDMGIEISREVKSTKELSETMARCLKRDSAWTSYHAETLVEALDREVVDEQQLGQAGLERKVLRLWSDGYYEKAIGCVEKFLGGKHKLDNQSRGWLVQLAARIADHWGQHEKAEDLQREAYACNRNLVRPKSRPPYVQLRGPGKQEQAIVERMAEYRMRRGYVSDYDAAVSMLNHSASANQFEQSLMELGLALGLNAERFDDKGIGPDVLWLLPNEHAIVFEAKSRKKEHNAFTKEDHGQLLVAEKWFKQNYPNRSYVAASVSQTSRATAQAAAECSDSRVLTYPKLSRLVADLRALIADLAMRQLDAQSLVNECARLLANSSLRADRIATAYLEVFVKQV